MKISLICPLYKNDPNYLKIALDSFVSQTGDSEKELIVVVDPPYGDCQSLLLEYEGKQNIKVIYNKERLGLVASRKMAIDAAQGEYIGFLDGDDYISPSFCEKMVDALDKTSSDMADCSFYRISPNGKESKNLFRTKIGVFSGLKACDQLLADANIRGFFWTKVYKKEIILQAMEDIKIPNGQLFEDFPINFAAMSKCEKVVLIKDRLYHYRKSEGETLTNQKRKDRAEQHLVTFALARHYADGLGKKEYVSLFKKHLLRTKMSIWFDISLSKKAGLSKEEIGIIKSQTKLLGKNGPLPIEGMVWEEKTRLSFEM
ncbi:MAG: glycosyltransferase family 2 protein [Bacilli bacterium]|nr:glycosyltransferase family 2 protein [Bacilli bacterium]